MPVVYVLIELYLQRICAGDDVVADRITMRIHDIILSLHHPRDQRFRAQLDAVWCIPSRVKKTFLVINFLSRNPELADPDTIKVKIKAARFVSGGRINIVFSDQLSPIGSETIDLGGCRTVQTILDCFVAAISQWPGHGRGNPASF